ncbi:MAG: transposase [Chloroflexota bacterium]
MRTGNLPEPFGVDKRDFSLCFSRPSLRHFTMLLAGWVLTVGAHTISRVILTIGAHEREHFASVYRFLSRAVWSWDSVSWMVFRLIHRTFLADAAEVVCVVDDTLNKHQGHKICGAGYQHDGSVPKGDPSVKFGVCFVLIGVMVRLPGISERVFCLPFAARLWWPNNTAVKPTSLVVRKKPELARELISMVRKWLDDHVSLRVVTDIGYSTKTILKELPEGVQITGKIRTHSALYEVWETEEGLPRRQGRPNKKGKRLPQPKAMFASADTPWRTSRIRLYGKEVSAMVHEFNAVWARSAGNVPLKIVLARDPKGIHDDCVFFDTDSDRPAEAVLSTYSSRWSVEIAIRETKGLLGSGDPQCRSEKSVFRAPMIAYWAYCLVVIWFVEQYRRGARLYFIRTPWYKHKKNISFSDMLAAARRSHFAPVFSYESAQIQTLPKFNPARSTRQTELTKRAKL